MTRSSSKFADADVERAASLLKNAMIAAFSHTFPGAPINDLLAVKIGSNWAAMKGRSNG
jgi:hypothetical protein